MHTTCTRLSLAFLFSVLVLLAGPAAASAAAAPSAAERAAHYEEALARAQATGKDIVVFQRGSDWNRLGETLYHEVWLRDEFARDLGERFILLAVDLPEQEGGRALPGLYRPETDGRCAARTDTGTPAVDAAQVAAAQSLKVKNSKFSWWDKTYCPRVALLDSAGRAVACENKPRLGLTPAALAARVKELRAVRENRDALWARAEAVTGPPRAELLRQSLELLGFANWAGNDNCYRPIHDKIRAADPQDESGAVRWLGFGRDPRDGVPWAEPSWSKALDKKELTDADYQEALARIDKELKDPRNRVLDHERIQRILIAKYHVYARWPKHEEQRFDVQREIAAFDPDTFWGIGAKGELGLRFRSATPMLTYGWAANQIKPGLNAWDLTDTAYFFDHAGPYKLRLTYTGGKDVLQVRRIALLDGATVLAEAKPGAGLGAANAGVEVDLDFKDWRAGRNVTLRVEVEAADGHTDSNGQFVVEPQLLPAPPFALQAAAKDEQSGMLARGEIGALRRKLGELLLTAAQGADGPQRILNSPALRTSLAQAELLRVCGEGKVAALVAGDGGAAFLQALFQDPDWLDSFLASGKADWPQALDNLYVLRRHGQSWEGPLSQRLATALALQWGSGSRYRLVDRFRHIQQALRDGLLHVSFEGLDVHGLRWAVPTYGTARDFQFLLDDRQTRLRDYFGAHGGVRYVSFNVYGLTVQDQWNYIAPWAHVYGTGTGNRPFPAHRQVGGVCGTVSTYGSAAAQVHGIPSTAIGQPGHCAYIIRVGQEWPVANSVTWPSHVSVPDWEGTGYSTLHRLYEPVYQDVERFLAATRLGWLAQLQASCAVAQVPNPPGPRCSLSDWSRTYDQALAAQPTNYGIWLDYVKTLETVKDLPPATWLELARRAARELAVAHEAGWALTRRCLEKALPGLPPAERLAVLVACHQELREEKWVKLEGFPYDGLLNWQADSLGDPALAVEFFGRLLTLHHSPKPAGNWIFGNVLSWGANRFAGNPATAPGYAKVLESFFQAQGAGLDKTLLATTLANGIRKASESNDLVSYRLWRDMATKMCPPLKPEDVHLNAAQAAAIPKYEPFAGELLSKDGLLQTSSACQHDRPLSYTQILTGGFGGYFDTNSEERPWAQVQLPGEAELSGLVLLQRYEHAPTEGEFQWAVPLKVTVSLDGKTWTEVATFAKADAVFRVNLQDKHQKARYVRIERLPGTDKTQPPGRFHFRNFLVYGTKLY